MISVKDFGAQGNDVADDTAAIRAAVNAAGNAETVYFPTGRYLVSSGINIDDKRLVGEPPIAGGATGTVIKVADSARAFKGGVLFSTFTFSAGPPCEKKAGNRVHLTSIQIDANFKADYGLELRGSSASVVWQVRAYNARLDNFLLDACQLAHFWLLTSLRAGRHGIYMIDCNGAKLQNFASQLSGFPTSQARKPNPRGCGLFITNECHSGGVYVAHGDIEGGAGPAIYVKNATKTSKDGLKGVTDMPTTIEKVWIENAAPADVVVLDATRNVTVQDCRISGGWRSDPHVRAIRLKNKAFNNSIRANALAVNGKLVPGTGMTTGDHIQVERGCANNHIEGNLMLRNLSTGPQVTFADRNHVVGQGQVICHAEAAPKTGEWRVGDIVFNTQPATTEVAGWMCVVGGPPVQWRAFGRFL
jgi:hypothetical protein